MKTFLLFIFLMGLNLNIYGQSIGENSIREIGFLKDHPKKMKLALLLWATKQDPTNEKDIYLQLKLEDENNNKVDSRIFNKLNNGKNFKTKNPYFPRYKEALKTAIKDYPILKQPLEKRKIYFDKINLTLKKEKWIQFFNQKRITNWFLNLENPISSESKEVCALKFIDSKETKYLLKTFKGQEEAKRKGWFVTHKYKCGTCSSLKDLAVYMAKPDLTEPVRYCTKKMGLRRIKNCLVHKVGFTERCSESWAYNADHTKKRCIGVCIKDYGLINIITNNMQGSNVDQKGKLRPCIACDEYRSGPGFKYAAARTRRWSGLVSAIKRGADEVYPINHFQYFKKTADWKWFD